MISTALLSKWHVHAGDYARQAQQNEQLTLKVVWDEDPQRGEQWAKALGLPFESDLSRVLSDPEIDAVIVDTPTNMHKNVIIQAAKNGKHIFSEKVLAFTVEDCREIYEAVESAGIHLMLSLPRLTDSYYVYAQDVLDRGLLGDLSAIRCRLAHNGGVPKQGQDYGWLPAHFFDHEQCGGGALIDLGAHPIYLTNRLAGPASALTAQLTSFLNRPVDDNATVMVEYESGANGIIEASFVSAGSPFVLELYGTEGTLLIEDAKVRLKSNCLEEKGWIAPEELPKPLKSPMEQWVDAILNKNKPSIIKEDAISLTKINEAALTSHRAGKRILLNS